MSYTTTKCNCVFYCSSTNNGHSRDFTSCITAPLKGATYRLGYIVHRCNLTKCIIVGLNSAHFLRIIHDVLARWRASSKGTLPFTAHICGRKTFLIQPHTTCIRDHCAARLISVNQRRLLLFRTMVYICLFIGIRY